MSGGGCLGSCVTYTTSNGKTYKIVQTAGPTIVMDPNGEELTEKAAGEVGITRRGAYWGLDSAGSGGSGGGVDYFNLRLTATSDRCDSQGRHIQYVVTSKGGGGVPGNLFVYEIQTAQGLASGGPFPGTAYQSGSQFSDWLFPPVLGSISSTQWFGVSLTRPNASGVPGGHLLPINWSQLGGGVVATNSIQMSASSVVVNGIPCHD